MELIGRAVFMGGSALFETVRFVTAIVAAGASEVSKGAEAAKEFCQKRS